MCKRLEEMFTSDKRFCTFLHEFTHSYPSERQNQAIIWISLVRPGTNVAFLMERQEFKRRSLSWAEPNVLIILTYVICHLFSCTLYIYVNFHDLHWKRHIMFNVWYRSNVAYSVVPKCSAHEKRRLIRALGLFEFILKFSKWVSICEGKFSSQPRVYEQALPWVL
jgi:hypothetical protein